MVVVVPAAVGAAEMPQLQVIVFDWDPRGDDFHLNSDVWVAVREEFLDHPLPLFPSHRHRIVS